MKSIVASEKHINKLKRKYAKKKGMQTLAINDPVGGDDDDDDDDDEDDGDTTAKALRQAKQVLAEKIKNIEIARETIYKNGVLVNTWKHEQELRHAMDQVNEFKENLKIWAKEQAKETKEKRKSAIKNLKWSVDSAVLRLEKEKSEYNERKKELNEKR
jgi:hypothetical protein